MRETAVFIETNYNKSSIMDVKDSYNEWAKTYDSVENKTRDLDKVATQRTLSSIDFSRVLEIGCGTGKNSSWLIDNAERVISIDFSEKMLAIARKKIQKKGLTFYQHDLTEAWPIQLEFMDLITCNLVLEHIKDLNFIFQQAHNVLQTGGYFFICELHPFKQYQGSKARFETESGTHILETHVHHITSFTSAARWNKFRLVKLNEWFDDKKEEDIPRLVSFVFQKI